MEVAPGKPTERRPELELLQLGFLSFSQSFFFSTPPLNHFPFKISFLSSFFEKELNNN